MKSNTATALIVIIPAIIITVLYLDSAGLGVRDHPLQAAIIFAVGLVLSSIGYEIISKIKRLVRP